VLASNSLGKLAEYSKQLPKSQLDFGSFLCFGLQTCPVKINPCLPHAILKCANLSFIPEANQIPNLAIESPSFRGRFKTFARLWKGAIRCMV
jgi:hypothetical protein